MFRCRAEHPRNVTLDLGGLDTFSELKIEIGGGEQIVLAFGVLF